MDRLIAIGLLLCGVALSGCSAVDPWSLLPSGDRVLLQMAGSPDGPRQSITVDQLLRQATNGPSSQTSELRKPSTQSPQVPIQADLTFASLKETGLIKLDAEQFKVLTELMANLKGNDRVAITIEVPAHPHSARITAFRKAAAIARYFQRRKYRVQVRPVSDLDSSKLRIRVDRRI